MELFAWLKGIHVASVIVWIGAIITTATLLTLAGRDALRAGLAPVVRPFYLRVQSPAMGLTLITGITQMVLYIQQVEGWMKTNIWLHYKIMVVFGLLVLDHILMRRALKLHRSPEAAPGAVKLHLAAVAVFALAAILLATVQPIK